MYRIALCDDEPTEIMKTSGMLNNYKKTHSELDFDIATFESAEQLLLKVQKGYVPDLILMDIYMKGKTGMAAVKELRKMEIGSRVIFLTTSEKHALEAFRMNAVQYLVKPVTQEELFPILDDQLEVLCEERRKYVALIVENKTFRVMVRDIVYCEALGKRQYLHLTDGSRLCIYMSMVKLEELFASYEEIIRLGKGYILNLDHVESLNSQYAQMDNGQRLYLPRGAYQALRKQYITYYTGVMS